MNTVTKLFRCVSVLLPLGFGLPVLAEVTLSHLFGDNMVLQRDMPLPVWGTADPGETVEVRFGGHLVSVQADHEGNWMATLPTRKDGKHLQLIARGGNPAKEGRQNTVTCTDVIMGEVWVCVASPIWKSRLAFIPDRIRARTTSRRSPRLTTRRFASWRFRPRDQVFR